MHATARAQFAHPITCRSRYSHHKRCDFRKQFSPPRAAIVPCGCVRLRRARLARGRLQLRRFARELEFARGVEAWKTEVRNQKSEIRSQRSEVRDRKSEI